MDSQSNSFLKLEQNAMFITELCVEQSASLNHDSKAKTTPAPIMLRLDANKLHYQMRFPIYHLTCGTR
jgi:hypothetical protein